MPVLGSRANIKNLVKKRGIKEIIVAVPSLSVEDFSEIVKICKECGVSYKRVKGILDKEKVRDEVDEFGKK